jgi:hypothetical protein
MTGSESMGTIDVAIQHRKRLVASVTREFRLGQPRLRALVVSRQVKIARSRDERLPAPEILRLELRAPLAFTRHRTRLVAAKEPLNA